MAAPAQGIAVSLLLTFSSAPGTHTAITIAILRGRGPQWGWDLPEITQYKVPEAEIGLGSPGAPWCRVLLPGRSECSSSSHGGTRLKAAQL